MAIYPSIEKLLYYGREHLMLDDLDYIYVRNLILDALKLNEYVQYEIDTESIDILTCPDEVLNPIVDYAVSQKITNEADRDTFGDMIMNLITKRPSEVTDFFLMNHRKYQIKAFEWLYDYSFKSDFIKGRKVLLNKHWEAKATKGKIEININSQVFEEEMKKSKYPECSLCKENEGFVSARTLRTIPVTLSDEEWFWQYLPQNHFYQSGALISAEHHPVHLNAQTLQKMLEFCDFAPSFFVGYDSLSNLSHEHFIGGAKVLPMFKAPVEKTYKCASTPYIEITGLDWYGNVLSFSYTNKEHLSNFVIDVINKWLGYNEDKINAIDNGVTVVARRSQDQKYTLDVIFRNRTTISKEGTNVVGERFGLTEACGYFVLPARLKAQMEKIERYLTKESRFNSGKVDEVLVNIVPTVEKLIKETGSKVTLAEANLNFRDEIGRICEGIIASSRVFTKDEDFVKFLDTLDIK